MFFPCGEPASCLVTVRKIHTVLLDRVALTILEILVLSASFLAEELQTRLERCMEIEDDIGTRETEYLMLKPVYPFYKLDALVLITHLPSLMYLVRTRKAVGHDNPVLFEYGTDLSQRLEPIERKKRGYDLRIEPREVASLASQYLADERADLVLVV